MLVSSLTLFAGVASQLSEWASTVAQANEILDQAETQGLPAHRARWRRRFELDETTTAPALVEQVELCKDRLRKPSR